MSYARRRIEEGEKIYKRQRQKRTSKIQRITKWRKKWKERGPVEFAENVLTCPPDVPDHPDLGRVPDYLILSDDQKEFLNDLWKEIDLAIVSAGRGAGKTLVLAIWICWQLCCFDRRSISSLAGSSKQSRQIQKYLDDWIIDVPEVKYCINASIKGPEPTCRSRFGGEVKFLACSRESVRGSHVPIVFIDEASTAERKQEGREAVDAIWWQITGKKVGKVVLTSTTDFVFGKFYEYLMNPEKYGFKRYMWEIAEHVSGKPPEATYKDRNPANWKPKVWWITQEDIQKLRPKSSDSEWLCECLGRPSMASGAVFAKVDLDVVICKLCEECYPYVREHCPLIEQLKLGGINNKGQYDPLLHVGDRRAGFDFGTQAPCALTIAGRKGQMIFVLYSDERRGMRARE